MNDLNEWFRWAISLILVVTQAFIGWLGHTLYRTNEKVGTLKEKIAVLEARPHVDPIEYAKAITQLAHAISDLTKQLAANDQHRTEQINNLVEQNRELKQELRDIKHMLFEHQQQLGQG